MSITLCAVSPKLGLYNQVRYTYICIYIYIYIFIYEAAAAPLEKKLEAELSRELISPGHWPLFFHLNSRFAFSRIVLFDVLMNRYRWYEMDSIYCQSEFELVHIFLLFEIGQNEPWMDISFYPFSFRQTYICTDF